jgi:hypothetical protein
MPDHRSCAAQVYADGSWYCQLCGLAGDKDEPVEDYCRRLQPKPSEDATQE